MTDQALDQLMKRVLLDALRSDGPSPASAPSFSPSPGYLRQMRAMVRNPLKWARAKARPVWRRVLYQAAVVLLVLFVGFGGVMAAVPSVRAAVIQWVTEWYETHVVYRYGGEDLAGDMPRYEIAGLPQGFVETDRVEFPATVSVAYEDNNGDVIWLDYSWVAQGGAEFFLLEDCDVFDITIHGWQGQFLQSRNPGEFNTVTWIDEGENLQFTATGPFDQAGLLNIAEHVSLVETTK